MGEMTESGKVYDCSERNDCQNVYIYCKACNKINGYKYHFPKIKKKE